MRNVLHGINRRSARKISNSLKICLTAGSKTPTRGFPGSRKTQTRIATGPENIVTYGLRMLSQREATRIMVES
jgi:hypothetical protein